MRFRIKYMYHQLLSLGKSMDSNIAICKSISMPRPNIQISEVTNKIYEINELIYKLDEELKSKSQNLDKKQIRHKANHIDPAIFNKYLDNSKQMDVINVDKIDNFPMEVMIPNISKELQISELSIGIQNSES
jgi:hypothetical protein